jgi:hypothetical protein
VGIRPPQWIQAAAARIRPPSLFQCHRAPALKAGRPSPHSSSSQSPHADPTCCLPPPAAALSAAAHDSWPPARLPSLRKSFSPLRSSQRINSTSCWRPPQPRARYPSMRASSRSANLLPPKLMRLPVRSLLV